MKVNGIDWFISVMMTVLAVFAFISGSWIPALLMLAYPVLMISLYSIDRIDARALTQAKQPELISGRTPQEWYETVKSIGPAVTEELMIGPLDGLERDKESAWNPEKLMG